jgi:hypothetical protein
MKMVFEGLINIFMQWDIIEFLVPFILVFTIVFAILQKTKILGDGRKNYNVIVALVMGLAVVVPHFTGMYTSFDPVYVINSSLPQVSIILVAIIMVLLIIGVFGNELDFAGTSLAAWVVIAAVIIVALIFGSSVGWFYLPAWLGFLTVNPELQALIVMVLIFAVIIWFITKEPKKSDRENKRGFGKLIEDVGKSVKAK